MENQSMDDIRLELGKIIKTASILATIMQAMYRSTTRLNITLMKDRLYERYTTIMIKGSMMTPRFRAISVDLDFHVRGY